MNKQWLRPKGTRDYYDDDWLKLETIRQSFLEVAQRYGFDFWETPIFESAELFQRSSGQFSDIVHKQLYHFEDKAQRLLALRAEGTAPALRALKQAKKTLPQKVAYFGPMFRYEKPQTGRQRQFFSGGVEWLSVKSNDFAYQIILLAHELLIKLGISNYQIELNWLGDNREMQAYNCALKKYLAKYEATFSPITKKRLAHNPLKIFDDKDLSKSEWMQKAPLLKNFCQNSYYQFETILKNLKALNLKVKIVENPTLVRGLDYYQDLVFEFVSLDPQSGAKSTLLAGGAYQEIVKEILQQEGYGIGFGFGAERLMLTMAAPKKAQALKILVFADNKDDLQRLVAWHYQNYSLRWNWEIVYETKSLAKVLKTQRYLHFQAFLYFQEAELFLRYQKKTYNLELHDFKKRILEILNDEGIKNETIR